MKAVKGQEDGKRASARSILQKVQAYAELAQESVQQARRISDSFRLKRQGELDKARKEAEQEIEILKSELAKDPRKFEAEEKRVKQELKQQLEGVEKYYQEKAKQQAIDLRWWWLLAYDIARYEEQYEKTASPDFLELIKDFKTLSLPSEQSNNLIEGSIRKIQDYAFAARWAELELR